ncbi:MAG: hypothetical protein K1Y02_06865 [Candidatus Hydrogenedentes bacterium]|nr:hypothetical protein [Candidatus Hydrogenedentota bacterium]
MISNVFKTVLVSGFAILSSAVADNQHLDIAGISLTPHVMADSMRYARDPEPAVGARVQLFLRNAGTTDAKTLVIDKDSRVLFDGKAPAELLDARAWSWHDTPSARPNEETALPPGALTVWTFNSRTARFGPGGRVPLEFGPENSPWLAKELALDKPGCWLSAVTFLGPDSSIQPDQMIVHVANASDTALDIRSCRLWLPPDPKSPRVLLAQASLSPENFNGHTTIPPGDRGGFMVRTGPLPLTYAAIEVELARAGGETLSVWAYLRIKPERFDISGGWVNGNGNPVTHEVFLKALKRLYVNTAHLLVTPGYSDTPLYERYPLKYFGAIKPLEIYDTDAMLPKIHGVEFLGEPQYGGGRPVLPQEVWTELHPYTTTRLATTVTHSEERIWRDYAGLSDFPHYDAYRVTAPSADAWRKYERWGKDVRIGWGAPLETIGDMCRSLRELNRPMPCAIWSQGPHEGWEQYGGRKRTSPTPDEIRMQAYHAISTRITSLYWFNLSLKTLTMWRDTLDEVGRIGRELRMIDEFLLEGDAYQFERLTRGKKPDWDLASVCGPRAALLFALDLDYVPDRDEKVFKFGEPRSAKWRFQLPTYFGEVKDVFRLDADGLYDTNWSRKGSAVEIREKASRAAIYVVSPDASLRSSLEAKRQRLVAAEDALQFDPARNDADFQQLVELLQSLK